MALANQIDTTYFTGIINIDFDDTDRAAHMTNLITYWQQRIFRELLGESLYQDLVDNSGSAPWPAFLDGETVTIDGYKYEWVGAKTMLSYFLYFYFKRDAESQDSNVGEKISNTENSSRAVDELPLKLSITYNQAIDYYKDAYDYIQYKNSLVDDTFANITTSFKTEINKYGI